ncbi:hypothetical protein CcI156_20770 [Frankia sp. CcI156]|nr:hypothetical protein BMG523Draft_04764 [Frankia sp. BMG5.23]OFB39929.1 hypothetical protein Manayef4_19760 [Frankia sp. CgIM4]OHV50296.1 hypothetical protein CgIS1_20515 [Frankia sp. CgIS1]ONH22616.1 hypothetical protein CcI156_20770 [Frankia sp. CcI156]ORT47326.1 hypothetical protein KBI5_20345 [Frankia sp. KB5]
MAAGWVPPCVQVGPAAWTPYQEALHVLLLAAPVGPTGVRLRGELVRLDPRSVVALADMVRDRRPVRV